MGETTVTLVGRIGQPPVLRTGSKGDWASFRMATNPRYKQGESWVDGPTSWLTVNADGDLAHNVVSSLDKGQQVIVQGTLSVREVAQEDGSKRTYVNVQASAVGADLRWGTTRFTRAERSAPAQQPAPPQQQAPARAGGDWGGLAPESAPAPQQQTEQAWGTTTLVGEGDPPF